VVQTSASSSKGQSIPGKRILVVDDEPFVCDAVRMMLTFDGHQVTTVTSGKDALKTLEAGVIDLVITDFAMPSMRGDELAVTIKSRWPGMPVVMITAYAEMLSSSNLLDGVDRLVSKPFMLEDLRRAMNQAMTGRKNQPPSGGA
jgi:CheY-like chemotaxis protein